MSDATRYPLCWPPGRPRTSWRKASKFKVASFARVRDELLGQLKLMGVKDVILSANLKLRQDGLPLAGQAQPADPGVAVYFTYKGKEVCFACDRWNKIEDNMQAVRHTIDALRGIARWGTGDMVDAAFTGFQALAAARVAHRPWHEVLGVAAHHPTNEVTDRYRQLAKDNHPDRGGDQDKAAEINGAWEEFKRERGL